MLVALLARESALSLPPFELHIYTYLYISIHIHTVCVNSVLCYLYVGRFERRDAERRSAGQQPLSLLYLSSYLSIHICIYVYVYMYIYIYIYIYMYIHIHISLYISLCIHTIWVDPVNQSIKNRHKATHGQFVLPVRRTIRMEGC